MQPKQKNWVFLACMLIVALFSVAVVFRNVRHRGQYVGQSVSTTNVQEVMVEIGDQNKALERALREGNSGRSEAYARASKIAALFDELLKEAPDNPTAERIGMWDQMSSDSARAANMLADIAGDPATELVKTISVNQALQKSCVDCHDQFKKE